MTRLDETPVIAVSGDLDWLSCGQLESQILDAARSAKNSVIVDLNDVKYIESSPLGTLIKTHVLLDRNGGDIALVCGETHVSRAIRQFGIDHLLPLYPDRESALAHLESLKLTAH